MRNRLFQPSILVVLCVVMLSHAGLAAQDRARPDDAVQDRPAGARIEIVRDVVYATIADDGEAGGGESEQGDEQQSGPLHLLMDVAFPRQSDGEPMPAVIYIPGEDWSRGDKTRGRPFLLQVARGGYFVATLSYRSPTQARFPAQLHDVKAAVRFLRDYADELVIDPDRIGVFGHAAGGHLASLLATTASTDELEGSVGTVGVSSSIRCAAMLGGWADLRDIDGNRAVDSLVGGRAADEPNLVRMASPVVHAHGQAAPMLLIHGRNDNVVDSDQIEQFDRKLQETGADSTYHEVDAGRRPMGREAMSLLAAFLDRHLGGAYADVLEADEDRGSVRPVEPPDDDDRSRHNSPRSDDDRSRPGRRNC